jgi:hypothetical protein
MLADTRESKAGRKERRKEGREEGRKGGWQKL